MKYFIQQIKTDSRLNKMNYRSQSTDKQKGHNKTDTTMNRQQFAINKQHHFPHNHNHTLTPIHTYDPSNDYQKPFNHYPPYLYQGQINQDKTLIKMTSIINQLDECVFQKPSPPPPQPNHHHESYEKHVKYHSTQNSIITTTNLNQPPITYASLTKHIKKGNNYLPFQQGKDKHQNQDKDNMKMMQINQQLNVDKNNNKQVISNYQRQLKQLKTQNKHLQTTIQKLHINNDALLSKIKELQQTLKSQIVINLQLQKYMTKMMQKKHQEQSKKQQDEKKKFSSDNYFKDIEKKYYELLAIHQQHDQKIKNHIFQNKGKSLEQPTRHQTIQSTIVANSKQTMQSAIVTTNPIPKNTNNQSKNHNNGKAAWGNVNDIKMNLIEGKTLTNTINHNTRNSMDSNGDGGNRQKIQGQVKMDLQLHKIGNNKKLVITDRF